MTRAKAKARRYWLEISPDGKEAGIHTDREAARRLASLGFTIVECIPVPRVTGSDGVVSVNGEIVWVGIHAQRIARDLRRALRGAK